MRDRACWNDETAELLRKMPFTVSRWMESADTKDSKPKDAVIDVESFGDEIFQARRHRLGSSLPLLPTLPVLTMRHAHELTFRNVMPCSDT